MKKLIRLAAILLCVATLFSFVACSGNSGKETETTTKSIETTTGTPDRENKMKIVALKGPTGMGMLKLSVDRTYAYDVSFVSNPTEIVSMISTGEVDIAACPLNLAATLYKKTNGGVQMLAINTLGVLSILENGNSIKSIADLKGKTIYATGQGSTPEYILNFVLSENGINPETDVKIEYIADHSELAAKAAADEVSLVMLPEPHVSTVLNKNTKFRKAVSMTAEWDAVCAKKGIDSTLAQGCLVVRTDYAKENPELISEFLDFYEMSINYVRNETTKKLAAIFLYEQKFLPSADIALACIDGSNLAFIIGEEMMNIAKQNLSVLYEANPASVGGALPDESFYYIP